MLSYGPHGLISHFHEPGSPQITNSVSTPPRPPPCYLQLQRVRVQDKDSVLAATPQPPTHRHHLGDGTPLRTQGHRLEILGVPEMAWSGIKKTE